MTQAVAETITSAYNKSRKRLLLLDYDGTLVPFAPLPELAKPTPKLLTLLRRLAANPHNTVALITGRPQPPLEQWFKDEPFIIFAEHGALLKHPGQDWQILLEHNQRWKTEVLRLMQTAVEQVPGSFIEYKTVALVWHYRPAADRAVAKRLARRLRADLEPLIKRYELRIVASKLTVEARLAKVHKGTAARRLLREPFDFILAAGDDLTDEDLFTALPDSAHTIKIGAGATRAKHRLASPKALTNLLESLLLAH